MRVDWELFLGRNTEDFLCAREKKDYSEKTENT